MQRHRTNIESLRRNLIFSFLLSGIMTLIFSGCVKPAASSTFGDRAQKQGEIDGENSLNSIPLPEFVEVDKPPTGYSNLVRKYADRYHLDWALVLAVMKQESRFDKEAVSHRGAYGLMQIMPTTQSELVDKLGVSDASTPRNNIRAGIYHLRSMYRAFPKARGEDRIELALAAYNAGLTRIRAARDVAQYLGQDPNSWKSVKSTLPLLSQSYYSLHRDIWHESRPPCGYFNGYRQTLTYVENIMQYYDDYSLALK